ncbi:AAA family ATPase [Haloarcula amylovorans]|uniref:AAA family ATPase n=1 Tax=Haloarcula amylovorans TaxID=2562280 RepID=UPI00107620A3|nr:AAA family ATPase [Halomicroarcula amylolytica]
MNQQTRLTDDEPDDTPPQVFMMPVNREQWLDDFKRTVDTPFEFGPDCPTVLQGQPPTRIWGTRTGSRNENMWSQLAPGDIMLFYTEGWFFAAGKIEDTIRSSEAGDYIWDSEESQFIYTLTDYTHIAIRRATVWDWFDYAENFTRRGLSRVSPDRVDDFRADVGDIWQHITEYAVDDGIEAILGDTVTEPNPAIETTDPDTSPTYFILRTGGGDYEDTPADEYHFKEGIPGSKQLREAAPAKFVYLEDKEFYATGEINTIEARDRDGTTHYFAAIENYNGIGPVDFEAVRESLDKEFPIQYGIIKITKQDYERIISNDPTDPEFEPADTYESVTAATDDITARCDRLEETPLDWFEARLTATIIDDWTTALRQFNPETTVDPEQAVKYAQLRDLYQNSENELVNLTATIKSGRLSDLSKVETLFLALVRTLQRRHNCELTADPDTLGPILHDDYETAPADSPIDVSHPLLEYLTDTPEAAVYRFTASPEYWLTSIATGTVSFEETNKPAWDRLSQGDVILFDCQETNLDIDAELGHGFIGAGIVGHMTKKPTDDPWWWDEYNADATFPFLASFEALYLTGDPEPLTGSNPITADTTAIDLTDSLQALTQNLLPYDKAERLCETNTGQGLAISETFSPFLDDNDQPSHDRPRLLIEAMAKQAPLTAVPPIDITQSFDGELDHEDILDGLHFEGDRGSELVDQVESALCAGKHVIFTGPPGTGKTEVARRIANQLVATAPQLYTDTQLTTATADWSTFDTVGGYMPDGSDADSDQLEFSPGVVLNRFKSRRPPTQRNEPLIIDELNRADIDKAFGQLFTLLSGQSVQLPYLKDGAEVELQNAADLEGLPDEHQYVVPASWRLFATMNTYDKTSLYEMSYAFMRRFAFIRVDVPPIPETDNQLNQLMQRYSDVWDNLETTRAQRLAVGHVWRATNTAVDQRSIGPAIVEDLLRYLTQRADDMERQLTQAVISFIFPQLEGVPKRREILTAIAEVEEINRDTIEQAGRDMLQVDALTDDA